jgi:SP family sugar:H+ symporter-like MFS transporter
VLGLLGTLIQALSTIGRQYWVLIAGKIILNMSVGIASAVVGVYLTECAPASLRGTLMANYNVVQNVGYVLAAATVYGVVNRLDVLNWLLPICLQFILPIAIIACSPLLPESPRWLAGQGRLEEAAAVIRSLRKMTPDYTDEHVWAEVQEIQAAYQEIRSIQNGSGWAELFRGANLRRTLLAIGLQSLQQAQGVSFVSNYTVTTFLSLGIQNVFTIILILYVVLLVSSLGAFYLPDRVGRRTRESSSFVTLCTIDQVSTSRRICLGSSLDGHSWCYHHRVCPADRSVRQSACCVSLPLGRRLCKHLVSHPLVCPQAHGIAIR